MDKIIEVDDRLVYLIITLTVTIGLVLMLSERIKKWIRHFIPSPRKRYRFSLRVLSILAAALCTFGWSYYFDEKQYYNASLYLAGLGLISIFEFIVAEILAESRYPKRTEDILETLARKIDKCDTDITKILNETIQKFNTAHRQNISGTFHLKVELYLDALSDEIQTALVQIVQYAGSGGGRRWRFTLATKGIIGRCARTSRFEEVEFSDDDDFMKRMVHEFGFTNKEAEKITKGKSYCAVPVNLDLETIGVIYFFSPDKFTFSQCIGQGELVNTAEKISIYVQGAELLS